MKVWLALAFAVCWAGSALAAPPATSVRPMPRPPIAQPTVAVPPTESLVAPAGPVPKLRPMRRPEVFAAAEPVKPRTGLIGLLKPRAKPAKPSKRVASSRKGSVCGDPSIKGKTMPRIMPEIRGCGIEDPVSISSVDGVRLSEAATLNCTAARALKTWVRKGLRPAFRGNEVTQLNVAAHYSCRTRNNVRGAPISEHGRGNAIDISGIVFASGKELTVTRNFRTLRKAYKAGCGIFATTLGPGSDGYHEDHMHFDTAKRRSGPYCR